MPPRAPRDAELLAAGYTWRHRAYELGGMAAAVALVAVLVTRLATAGVTSWFLWPLSALAGLLIADFISGFVHWMFDTWWSVDSKVVGQLAVRAFRHHHIDPRAMTKHDFVETNGHNWALTPIYTGIGLAFVDAGETSLVDLFIGQTFLVGTFFVMVTSQFHKWAHTETVPGWVRLLQRSGIALDPAHHRTHHTPPFEHHYCVTNGWMNRPLRALGFFRRLERLVTWITGAVPRRDDLGDASAPAAARRTAEEEAARAATAEDERAASPIARGPLARASLERASLERASLERASLERASLERASLESGHLAPGTDPR